MLSLFVHARRRRCRRTRRCICRSTRRSARSSRPTSSASSSRRRPTLRDDDRRDPQGQARLAREDARHHAAGGRARCGRSCRKCARRIEDFQQVRQAGHRVSRVRRRAGVLPRVGGRPHRADAGRAARPDRPRHLRAVLPRRARQARRLSRPAAHRRLQDGVEHVHREGLHAGAPRDDAGRSTATGTTSSCAPSPPAASSPDDDVRKRRSTTVRSWPRARRRPGSSTRSRYEDQLDDDGADAGDAPARRRHVRSACRVSLADARDRRAHRAAVRRRHDRERQELVRRRRAAASSGRTRSSQWLRKVRVDPAIRADRRAHRQPRRIGDRVRSHLARADADARRQAASSCRWATSRRRAATTSPCRRTRSSREPGTITGSIGVVTGKFVLKGTLDKLGIGTGAGQRRQASPRSTRRSGRSRRRSARGSKSRCRRPTSCSCRASPRAGKSTPAQDRRGRAGPRLDRPPGARAAGWSTSSAGWTRAIQIAKERAKLDPKQGRRSGRLSAEAVASTTCSRTRSAATATPGVGMSLLRASPTTRVDRRRRCRCCGCSAAASR